MTHYDKKEDPIGWAAVEIVEPDTETPIAGCVGADTNAKYVLIEQAPPPEAPADETPSRRRRVATDANTPMRRSATGGPVVDVPFVPVPLRVYRDFDVIHHEVRSVLHRVRRFS